MKNIALFFTALFPALALAETTALDIRQTPIKTELEPQINVAKLEKREQNLPPLGLSLIHI